MVAIGNYITLTILRDTPPGLYLGDEQGNEVLLPGKYITDDMKVGEQVEVFIYLDSEDRPVATTERPFLVVNQFGYLRVKEVNKTGAFMDWGLEKDLLVPFNNQSVTMLAGKYYLVYMYLDAKTNRLVGTSKVNTFLSFNPPTYLKGQKVDLLITRENELGFQVIIDNKFRGMLYHNEIFQEVEPGQRMLGFVKQIREDNKIDVRLTKEGYTEVENAAEELWKALEDHSGFLPLTDKSAPEEVSKVLKMSKKVFKKAAGSLFKQRRIRIETDGIYSTKGA
ncbi:S1-like domain-containing RNA-binding protein [Cytophagales bacterium LB-30]|uniref:S1-like domain-containing RNA-binding protein n=1 Tax=Shiella aurantiaca TaxID=3058365 RepID=A0ABT8F8X5_9BACT|nr:S1-like domain-containing RNA-binding protein [Shiella aurantiaca]MDN4166838.1 S1-like domain-containing RNA-binding protein [Shiella aurantiaca]